MELPVWFGLTALATFGFVVVNFLHFRALALRGVKTVGLVIDAVQDCDEEPESLVVLFTDDQGIPHRIVTRSGITSWGHKKGQSMTIYYDPQLPGRARIREDVTLQTWFGSALGVLFAVISIVTFLR
jgi:hypothetical protein